MSDALDEKRIRELERLHPLADIRQLIDSARRLGQYDDGCAAQTALALADVAALYLNRIAESNAFIDDLRAIGGPDE